MPWLGDGMCTATVRMDTLLDQCLEKEAEDLIAIWCAGEHFVDAVAIEVGGVSGPSKPGVRLSADA